MMKCMRCGRETTGTATSPGTRSAICPEGTGCNTQGREAAPAAKRRRTPSAATDATKAKPAPAAKAAAAKPAAESKTPRR